MKMTLTSSARSSNNFDKTSENISPRSSPIVNQRNSLSCESGNKEKSKSDHFPTINYNGKEQHNGSPNENKCPKATDQVSIISNKSTETKKHKKKSSWLNVLYPTYKSKSSDFKRLFKDVPDDERLVVDYSCALQKEILVQGRLYVSQNYLCFHANIFGWETNVQLKWKDVTAITKEKTARVIPNAVSICTKSDRYFLTSFVTRDKTYLMLFRVWQNALMDQPMAPQEMWQWVHQSYGEELGLTSDDEDYVAPGGEEDKLSARLSVESFAEESSSNIGSTSEITMNDSIEKVDNNHSNLSNSESHFPSDRTESSDSNVDKCGDLNERNDETCKCTSAHDGRLLVNEILPIQIDQLFTLLFTNSKFYLDFHSARKTTDLSQTTWTLNEDKSKSRTVNLTLALNQVVGPKTAHVTENHLMLPCSKFGHLYAIDIVTTHTGIPYADSFYISVHYCLQKISDYESSMAVYAQIKYKRSLWGLVKGMIEKNCWAGFDDFFKSLLRALYLESEDNAAQVKHKTRRKRKMLLTAQRNIENQHVSTIMTNTTLSNSLLSSETSTLIVFCVLILLLILNVMLYYKLWSLEETSTYSSVVNLYKLQNPPKTHEEWIELFQQQEKIYKFEMHKWQKILTNTIKLLKQTEESLGELQRSITQEFSNKILSTFYNKSNEEKTNSNSEL